MSPVESTDLDGWSVFTGPWWWCHHRSVCWTLRYLAIQTSFLSTLWNLVQTFTQTQCHLSVFLTGKTHWKSRSETQTWLIVRYSERLRRGPEVNSVVSHVWCWRKPCGLLVQSTQLCKRWGSPKCEHKLRSRPALFWSCVSPVPENISPSARLKIKRKVGRSDCTWTEKRKRKTPRRR